MAQYASKAAWQRAEPRSIIAGTLRGRHAVGLKVGGDGCVGREVAASALEVGLPIGVVVSAKLSPTRVTRQAYMNEIVAVSRINFIEENRQQRIFVLFEASKFSIGFISRH